MVPHLIVVCTVTIRKFYKNFHNALVRTSNFSSFSTSRPPTTFFTDTALPLDMPSSLHIFQALCIWYSRYKEFNLGQQWAYIFKICKPAYYSHPATIAELGWLIPSKINVRTIETNRCQLLQYYPFQGITPSSSAFSSVSQAPSCYIYPYWPDSPLSSPNSPTSTVVWAHFRS